MSEQLVSSIDLFAGAKVYARECATLNKNFVLCKNEHGSNPDKCLAEGDLVTACTNKV